MSVLIKGMEMPTSCDDCRLNNGISCYAVPEYTEDCVVGKTDDRPNWCPLVEIPPHGRLIDADAMIRNIEKAITPSRYIKERNADMVKFLSLEDTIIPAEEDE